MTLLITLPTWQSVSGLVGSLEGFKVAGLCARLPTTRLWKLNESVLMNPKDSKECVGEAARMMTFSERLGRSEERRVGIVCVSTCRYRWSPSISKKKYKTKNR